MPDSNSRYDKYKSSSFRSISHSDSDFITPEEAAVADNLDDEIDDKVEIATKMPNKKSTKISRLIKWLKQHKIVDTAIVILIVIIGLSIYALTLHSSTKIIKNQQITTHKTTTPLKPKSNLVPSNLTGLMVNPSFNKLPVTGVMIENSLFARPQSGLGSAGVVFEALAEGGISRFLALYQDTQPNNVGPIRSARPYYISWDLGFDAPYAHVGGSPEALTDITNWNVKDLNQFYNGNYFHRITTRQAPHNVYTAIATLNQLETIDGYTSSTFTSWTRKADSPLKVPNARVINFYLSSPDYNVSYTYNPATNSYLRDEGGAPQIDANTNQQISPKVVIAIIVPYSLEADQYHLVYQTIGSGAAYVFQDGGVTIGQWSKSSNNAQILFTNSKGQPLALNAGQTWITALGDANSVSYTP